MLINRHDHRRRPKQIENNVFIVPVLVQGDFVDVVVVPRLGVGVVREKGDFVGRADVEIVREFDDDFEWVGVFAARAFSCRVVDLLQGVLPEETLVMRVPL